jgi:hypothetical protein
MQAHEGMEPVADDELLYRRIPVSMGWYDDSGVSPEAFDPRRNETTGISLFRAKYKSLSHAGKGKSKRGYYVAVLRARDIRSIGIDVVPRPLPDDSGHAELPELTCENRLSPKAQERKIRLSGLCIRVAGPFLTLPNS